MVTMSEYLFENRIIFLSSIIDEKTANNVITELIVMNSRDQTRQIDIYINSSGGNVFDGLAIYDVMQIISAPVATYCVGSAFSMAAWLLASGTKGKRFATPNSRIMIHQPWTATQIGARIEDMRILSQAMTNVEDSLIKTFAHHTGQESDKIRNDINGDFWLNATEALEYGIIDQIIEFNK